MSSTGNTRPKRRDQRSAASVANGPGYRIRRRVKTTTTVRRARPLQDIYRPRYVPRFTLPQLAPQLPSEVKERSMEDDVASAFSSTPEGHWLCVRSVAVPIRSQTMQVEPGTVITRGTRYFGIELATWLDKISDSR